MSLMRDEWKDGLPQRSLIKINEIEAHVERLKKERDQKQFQLESLEQALEVQKRKGSNDRLELSELTRETKYLSEKCEEWEKRVQKLTAELSVKDKQLSALEEKCSKAATGSQQSERTSSSQATAAHIEQIKSLENEIQGLKQQLDNKVTPVLPTSGTILVEEPKYSRNTQDTEKMSLLSQIQDLENRNKKLIQDGDCMRHNSEAARKHLELKMKEKEKELNLELAQALEGAKQCNNQLKESKIKFQQEINLAQAEQNRLKGLLEKAEAEKSKMNEKNQKISELEKNSQSLNDQLHSLKQEHSKLQKSSTDKINQIEAALKKKSEELDKLMLMTALEADQNLNKFEEMSKKSKVLENELHACQSKCEKGQQLINSLETQVSSLKKELEGKESCVSNVNFTLENVNQELQTKVKEIIELKSKLEQQEVHLSGLNNKLTVSEKNLEEINISLKDTGSRLKTKEDKVVELEKEITLLQNGRTDLETVLASLKEDNQSKLATISSLEKECASLKENLKVANLKQNETEQFLRVNQENMLLLENRLGQVEEQKIVLETSLNKELETLQENKNKLLEESNHKSSAMMDLENVNGDLLSKLKATQEKLSELSIEHEKEVALLKSQQGMLQKNVEDKDILLNTVTTQVTNLQSQFDNLKEDKKLVRDASISKETELYELRTNLEAAKTMIVDKDHEIGELKLANLNLERVITETKALLEKKDSELKQMAQDCELSAVKIKEYEEKLNSYETTKIELTNVIDGLQANITAEKELTQLKLSEIETLKLQCVTLTDQLNTAQSEIVNMQSEADCSIQNLKHLEAKQQELEQGKLTLENSLTSQLESLNQELEEKKKAVAEKDCLIEELQSCKEDLKAKLTAIKEDLLKDEAQHDQDLTTLKSKFELLQMDLEDKDSEIGELKNEISNLNSQLAKVEQDKETIHATLKSRELDLKDIKQTLNLEQEKCMSAELMQKNLLDEKFNLEQVLKTLREELDSKESDLSKHRHICEDHCEKIKEYEDKLQALEHTKEKIALKLSDLEEALDTERKTCAAKSLEIENLNHNSATLCEEVDVIKRSCQEKLEEINTLRHNCLQLELKCKQFELEKQECNEAVIANKNEAYEELLRENEKHLQELGELRKNLTGLQSKIDQLTCSVQTQEKHIFSLESQLTETIQVTKDYQCEISKLSTELSNVELCKKALENKIKHLEQEKSNSEKTLCWDFEQTKLKLNTVEEELLEKSVALEAMQTQYDNMNRSVLKANSKISDLQEEKNAFTDELLEMKKAFEDVKTELSENNATMAVLREELENTVLENETLRSDKSELLSQEEKYKLTIHELEIKLADIEIEIESTKESFESVSVQRFESQKKLSVCLREKDEVEKSLKELETELASVNCEMERLNSVETERDSLKREVLMKEDVISDLKLKVDDLSKINQAQSFEIVTIQKEKIDLKEELDSIMSRLEQFQENREEVSRDTVTLRNHLLMLQKAIESQNLSLDSKEKEVEKSNELLIKKNEISKLQVLEEKNQEIHQLKEENVTLKKEMKDLNATVGTLQDAIESLNYDLNLAEQEKNTVLSDVITLKCENNELKDKLSKVTLELEYIKTHQSENNQDLEKLEKDNIDLRNSLESLRIEYKDLGLELETVSKNEANLKIQLTTLQESLDENISGYASLQQELISASSERELTSKNLQACQDDLSRAQVNLKNLTSKIEELNYQIISMTSDIETKDFEIENLQKEVDKLKLKIEDTEWIGNNQLMEEQSKFELLEKEKAELNQRLTDLESELFKMKNFEEKACLYESLLIEKNQMKEKLLHLQLLEKEIENLKLSLHDREADFQSITDSKALLESNVLDMQEEIKNQKDLIRVKEQQLVVTQQEKLSVEAKLQELLEVADENVKLRAHVQDLEITLKSDKEMIESLKAKSMTKVHKVTDVKESISGKSNNDEIEWERKYSDQEDKIRTLEKELEKLKEEHVSTETIESLKAEREEAKTDAEFFSEAASESREKVDELTKNNKELLCKNDILKIKLKLFRDMLQKNNIPINSDSQTQEMEIPPIPPADFTKVKQEKNTPIKKMTFPSQGALNIVPENLTRNVPSQAALNIVPENLTPDVPSQAVLNIVPENLAPSEAVAVSKTSKTNSLSSLTKGTDTKKALQSVKRMPATVCLSPQCSSPSRPLQKVARMNPSSSDKKSPKVFKSPSAKVVTSLDKKRQFISKLASPKPKINATATKASPAAACNKFGLNEQASGSDVAKGSESAPQESTLSNGARRIPVGNAAKNTDLPDVLSPRKTRRSTKKRQSTDPTEEIAGGKKLKLANERTPQESTSTQKQFLKPKKSRTNSHTGIPKVSVAKPIKEAMPSASALATITNSPKKSDRNLKESLRPRGLSRIKQPGTQQTRPQIKEETEGRPDDCKSQ